MAIKVRHEGNVTSRIMASAAGGRGKRASEDGKAWMQIAAQQSANSNRQLQGAHASPAGISMAHAPTISAPTGSAPGIGSAGAHNVGGGVRSSGASRGVGSGMDSSPDYKITGDNHFQRPDADSMWNPNTNQWYRKWLPGEKEAEAVTRMNVPMIDRERQMSSIREDERIAENMRRQRGLADMERIKAGTHEYALSDADERTRREYEQEISNINANENLSPWQKEQGIAEMRKKIDSLVPVLRERSDPQSEFNKRMFNWNGVEGYLDGSGKFVASPKYDADMKQREYDMRRMDLEAKRAQDLEIKLAQGYKSTIQERDPESGILATHDIIVPYTEEQKAAIRNSLSRFSVGAMDNGGSGRNSNLSPTASPIGPAPATIGAPNQNAAAQPVADPKAKWGAYRTGGGAANSASLQAPAPVTAPVPAQTVAPSAAQASPLAPQPMPMNALDIGAMPHSSSIPTVAPSAAIPQPVTTEPAPQYTQPISQTQLSDIPAAIAHKAGRAIKRGASAAADVMVDAANSVNSAMLDKARNDSRASSTGTTATAMDGLRILGKITPQQIQEWIADARRRGMQEAEIQKLLADIQKMSSGK